MAEARERLEVAKTYKLYIDGKFPRTESGRYIAFEDKRGCVVANVCRASRKDFRNAMVAARKAFDGWASASAYLRGQIVYRIAEMLEGRSEQFAAELERQGQSPRAARAEVELSIDRLIHYAGWSDKYQQLFSSVNPVNSSHFNFSVPEPTGVVAIIAPDEPGLLGLVSNVAPALVGGNAIVLLASETKPLTAASFAEVVNDSDVPAGVVNVLTGYRAELAGQFGSHMDVNAVVCCEGDEALLKQVETDAAENVKRVVLRTDVAWKKDAGQGPYLIRDTQEIKTTWHPVGR